jgi:hypothetical protein
MQPHKLIKIYVEGSERQYVLSHHKVQEEPGMGSRNAENFKLFYKLERWAAM